MVLVSAKKQVSISKKPTNIPSHTVIGFFARYWVWHGLCHSYTTLKKESTSVTDTKRLRHLKLQILLHYFYNFFLFPIFLFKFLLPSYTKGKNSIWTNLKTILKNKEFHPLRIAIISQFLFFLVFAQLGVFIFKYYSNTTLAASYTWTQSSWTGGATTTLSALHPTNETNWNYFTSASSTVTTGSTVTLSANSDSTTETTDTDFNAGTLSNTTISGTDSAALLELSMTDSATTTAIFGSYYHNLALKSDGTVWAWGLNANGQLGDGTTANRSFPMQVNNLTDVIAASGGYYHSLALKSDGTVWAWGRNNYGQLGDGTTTDRTAPVQVLTGVIAIFGGYQHSLALKSDGTVWAWGDNTYGQLGDGSTTQRNTPIQTSTVTGVIAISAGWRHSLALKSDGTVWAWGDNTYGQLGDGSTTQRNTPIQTSTVTGVTAIAAGGGGGGSHSLALKSDGTVWAWGWNGSGELGDGTTTQRNSPVQTSTVTGVTAIAAGSGFSLALKSNGTVWAWGYNGQGRLGDGTTTNRSTPVQISIVTGVIAIARGAQNNLALKSDGTVWAWGWNGFGQLGDNNATQRSYPAQVNMLVGVVDISVGHLHSLALKSDGTVWAWGSNAYGQLGDGTIANRAFPMQVSNLTGVVAISAGWYHSLALKSDGTVWAWGQNTYGQIGDGTTTHINTPVQVLTGVIAIDSGGYHSLALKSDGTVWAWGQNTWGQLGDGSTTQRNSPVQTNTVTGVVAISGGYDHSLALKSDGTVWSWGTNTNGQIGDGTTTQRNSPVQTNTLTGVIAISGGAFHSFAIKSDGTVWSWGYNGNGQIGDGTTTQRNSPVQTNTLTGVIAIFTTYDHSLALKSDGTVWSWGRNNVGQIGDGTVVNKTSPVQVLTGAIDINAGGWNSFSLKSDGTVWAWGYNTYGQLGDNNATQRSYPAQVNMSTGVVVVAGNTFHSLALKSDGTVWAWGGNVYGQLGDGTTTTYRSIPIQVLNGVVAIANGYDHNLALKSDGTVWSWGWNSFGQLGDGTIIDRSTPIQVSALSGVIAISAGYGHSLALKSDGTVWSWGRNGSGQIGDGTITERHSPVQTSTVTGVIAISAGGNHSLALKSDGTVWAWGYNGSGPVGDGTTTQRNSPVQTSTVTGVIAISAGGNHSLALKSDGTVWAWGYNTYGQVGDGTTTQRNSPVQTSTVTGVIAIFRGLNYSLALKSNGTVWAWGDNTYGQIGDGTTTQRNSPVQTSTVTGVITLSGGIYHSLALKSDDTVWAWGRNDYGQVGDGTTIQRNSPVHITVLDIPDEYNSSGTFTSDIIDTGIHTDFTTLDYSATLSSQTVAVIVRAGDSPTVDGTWTDWSNTIASGGDISSLGSHRYLQYKATLSTEDTAVTPTFNDIALNYNSYSAGSLISSPYNTANDINVPGHISWSATTSTGATVKFQVRTSPDNVTWSSWLGPDGTGDTYFTDNTGNQDMPEVFTSGGDDQWLEYQGYLDTLGDTTPILSAVTFSYIVNFTPEISITTGTVSQESDGTISIDYDVRDVDSSTGAGNGTVTVQLQYCTANCSDPGNEVWATAGDSSLSGNFGSGLAVNTVATTTYTSYSLVWTPTVSYNNQYNATNFKIRLRVNDSELANNYGYSESNIFTLDTTDPVVDIFLTDARSDATSSISISVTEDTAEELLMKLSNNSNLSADGVNANSGNWAPFSATSSWTFASGNSPVVYYSIKDAYGNVSVDGVVSSDTTPQNPLNIVYRDISNAEISEWREFIAWGIVPTPGPGFQKYTIYRSTDGINYTELTTQTDPGINYYLDENLSSDTTYYYKVTTVDDDNNISKYSSIVSDMPNGQGGSDITAPTISSVTSTAIGTQSATITWDTNELSSSYVDYITATGGDFSSAPSEGNTAMVDTVAGLGQHNIVLTNLTPNTTYYFRVRSLDPDTNEGIGTSEPDGYTFTTLSGPAISEVSVSNVTNNTATITWTTDQASDSYIYYSTSSVLASPTTAGTDLDSVTSHSVTVSNLTRDTTYFFYVKSDVAEDKNVVDGNINYYTFLTTSDLTSPVITFDENTDVAVSDTTANISWSTDKATTSTLEYGTSIEYGTLATNNTYNSEHAYALTNLLQGTTYYARIRNSDINRNISSATEFTFATTDTRDVGDPVITSVTTTVITDIQALVTWSTDEGATGQVYYGTSSSTASDNSTSLVATYNRSHAITISDLTVLTDYYYFVVSADSSGNTSTSTISSFTTLDTLSEESAVVAREEIARAEGEVVGRATLPTSSGGGVALDRTPPKLSNVSISDISNTKVTFSWDTNEDSDGVVVYGTDENNYIQGIVEIPRDNLKKKHQVNILNLDPLTTYYYQITSADSSHNISLPNTGSFSTLSSTEEFISKTTSSTSDINNLQGPEAEKVFVTSLANAANLIRNMSTRVGIGILDRALSTQNTLIEELSKLLPTPIISGQPMINVTANSVVISWNTDKESNSLISFANENTYILNALYDQTIGEPDQFVLTHSVEIKNLTPDTIYHYNLVSRTATGAETRSPDFTFKTNLESNDILNYKVNVLSSSEVEFSWQTSILTESNISFTPYRNGTLAIDAKQTISDKSLTLKHTLKLTSLEAGVIYDIDISGKDTNDNIVSKTIKGFSSETANLPPIIYQVQTDSAIIPGDKERIQVIISWFTNELSTSRVLYQKGFSKENTTLDQTTLLDSNYTKKHVVVISDFDPGVVYQFQVESMDSSGNVSTSKTINILTPRKEESVFQVILNNIQSIFSWVGKVNGT